MKVGPSLRCQRDKPVSIQQTRGIHALEFLERKQRSISSPSWSFVIVEMHLVHLGRLSGAASGFQWSPGHSEFSMNPLRMKAVSENSLWSCILGLGGLVWLTLVKWSASTDWENSENTLVGGSCCKVPGHTEVYLCKVTAHPGGHLSLGYSVLHKSLGQDLHSF